MTGYKWSNMSHNEIKQVLTDSTKEERRSFLSEIVNDPRKNVQLLCQHLSRNLEKEDREERRIRNLWSREEELSELGYKLIAGIDEAGRGPLAGPVVAAAVILPLKHDFPLLNDSKKLKARERDNLAVLIKEKAVAWAVGVVDHKEIDETNILKATKRAMAEAVRQLSPAPNYLLIDALNLEMPLPQEGIIHGDGKCACIAAASILAKTYRDSLMDMVDMLYPEYGFKDHKGYGTARHLNALAQHGPCPIHRTTFLTRSGDTPNVPN